MSTVRVVAGVVFRHDGRLLAARRADDVARGGMWEFAGGKVESGEDDATALKRELMEELSIHVVVGEWLGEVRHDYDDVTVLLVAYRCELPEGEPVCHEHSEIAWLTVAEAKRLQGWAPADVPVLLAL
jgi:mutator protein MutT